METPDILKGIMGEFDKPAETPTAYEKCLETIEKLKKQLEEEK